MMPRKPLIKLYDSNGIGVIIKYPSGVLYSNQVGGTACLQPTVEGVFVPFYSEVIAQEQMLIDYFIGPKWGGACMNGIDDDDADKIDEILQANIVTRFIHVDRTRLSESVEAWIHVVMGTTPHKRPESYNGATGMGITSDGDYIFDKDFEQPVPFYSIYGFGKCQGILTWCNSD